MALGKLPGAEKLRDGIGSLIGGKFGGMLVHHFGEVQHRPERIWWVLTGLGIATTALLWVYDKTIRTGQDAPAQ